MGWWWSADPSPSSQPPQTTLNAAPELPPTESNADTGTQSPTERQPPLSRDEIADQEFRQYLSELSTENRDGALRGSPKKSARDRLNSTGESLYPTEMSCRQALDEAHYCSSFGGQFMNIYRYGELRSCSEHWNAFWFCMRIKSYSDSERKAMVRRHYQEKAAKYKLGPSSEDVWRARTEPLREAFNEDPDAAPLHSEPDDIAAPPK